MRTWLGVGLAMFLGVGLVLLGLAPSRAALAVRSVAPTHAQRLMYQTNWRHGKLGWSSLGYWNGPGKWQVVNGHLLYDAGGSSAMYAPYRVTGWNYAVEATMRTTWHDPSDWDEDGMGVIVRAADAPSTTESTASGIVGGAIDLCCSKPSLAAMQNQVEPNGMNPEGNILASSDFDPGNRWHTYRLEVRGNSLRLLVDGQLAASTTSNQGLSWKRVGLFACRSAVDVKVFKVFSL